MFYGARGARWRRKGYRRYRGTHGHDLGMTPGSPCELSRHRKLVRLSRQEKSPGHRESSGQPGEKIRLGLAFADARPPPAQAVDGERECIGVTLCADCAAALNHRGE